MLQFLLISKQGKMDAYFVDKHFLSKSMQIITTKQIMKFPTIPENIMQSLSSFIFIFHADWNDEEQELKKLSWNF